MWSPPERLLVLGHPFPKNESVKQTSKVLVDHISSAPAGNGLHCDLSSFFKVYEIKQWISTWYRTGELGFFFFSNSESTFPNCGYDGDKMHCMNTCSVRRKHRRLCLRACLPPGILSLTTGNPSSPAPLNAEAETAALSHPSTILLPGAKTLPPGDTYSRMSRWL